VSGFPDPSAPEARWLAQFLEEYEQAADKTAVLRRWSEAQPQRAERLAALVAVDRLLARVGPDRAPAPPERLGDFRIVCRIAGGGMGVVYEACQEPFGRRVAVKTIGPRSFSAQARERFLREQRVLAGLHHTHIVPIYAAGRADDLDYFAMPYIDGVSLRDLIRTLRHGEGASELPSLGDLTRASGASRPPEVLLPPGADSHRLPVSLAPAYLWSVAELLAEAAEAITHAHEQGIIHRDLKPANLMVDVHGHIWVLDFGLAGYRTLPGPVGNDPAGAESSGERSMPGGTLDYMAPEQLDGSADSRTDVWGLGVVLYELLTLHRAYAVDGTPEGDTLLARRRRELTTPLSALHTLARGVPEDLEAICQKCLAKVPADRYPSAGELADDLRRHLWGEETKARPYRALERVGRWGRRHPAGAGLLAAAAAVLLCVAVVAGDCWELQAGNAQYARKLARGVDRQLQLVSLRLGETARKPELARRLGEFQTHPEDMPDFLTETKKDFDSLVNWFKRPGEKPPFFNWFVMDRAGNIVTDTGGPFTGNYKDRDYAHLLTAGDAERDAVYLSRVFRSEIHQREYKYAVTARTWDGARVTGVVAAAIAVDSQLVALDMKDEAPGAQVVAPMDWSRKPGDDLPPEPLPKYIVMLHADYSGAGTRPLWVDAERLSTLERFARDPALTETVDLDYRNGGFVHYARVGASQFVVLVPRSYPWPIDMLRLQSMQYGGVLALLCLAAVGLHWGRTRWRAARFPQRNNPKEENQR
jgi:serine/threonine protein kinase